MLFVLLRGLPQCILSRPPRFFRRAGGAINIDNGRNSVLTKKYPANSHDTALKCPPHFGTKRRTKNAAPRLNSPSRIWQSSARAPPVYTAVKARREDKGWPAAFQINVIREFFLPAGSAELFKFAAVTSFKSFLGSVCCGGYFF